MDWNPEPQPRSTARPAPCRGMMPRRSSSSLLFGDLGLELAEHARVVLGQHLIVVLAHGRHGRSQFRPTEIGSPFSSSSALRGGPR